MNTETINIEAAAKMYKSHLKNVSEYQKRNPDKMKAKCLKYNEKIRADPEKHEELKQKKKDYYNNVVKPKNEAKKKEKELQNKNI